MAEGTQLSMTEDGRLAVTKRAAPGPGADRLRREADVLERAAHPGVVELLAVDLIEGVVLHTAFAGGGALAEHLGALRPTKALDAAWGAKVAADLTATLSDLHGRGIAHQRVTADHVLVTDVDHVRLCGFAEATTTSDASPCDPDVAAVDVDAVATLVGEIADGAGSHAASLRAVADRVLHTERLARPSMRSLAQSLADLVGGGEAPTPPAAQGRRLLPARHPAATLRPRPGRRGLIVAIAAVALVVSAVLIAMVSAPASRPVAAPASRPVAAPPSASRPPATTTTTPATLATSPEPAGVRVWPPGPLPDSGAEGCPSPVQGDMADVDGDGCTEVVEVADGVVSVSGRRWQVASDGDLVAVGDWDCDGLATPAVVRHDTGDVWVFARWAEGTEGVPADPAGTVPGAVSAVAVEVDGQGCHDLEVVDTAGKTTRLDLDT